MKVNEQKAGPWPPRVAAQGRLRQEGQNFLELCHYSANMIKCTKLYVCVCVCVTVLGFLFYKID